MFDIKIINGCIADGTGCAMYSNDIGIIDDRIAKVGDLSGQDSLQTIDAAGKIVAPGFIDMHTHSDLSILYDRKTNSKIYDGVTTEAIGNCGIGVAPVIEETKKLLIDYLGTRMIGSIPVAIELPWKSLAEYFSHITATPPAVNVAPLLAHGTVRVAVMGFDNRAPSPAELNKMKEVVRCGMAEGAMGMSTGLIYLPGEFAKTDELIELARVVGSCGGIYTTHIRNEREGMFAALEEALNIGRMADIPVHISHLKLASEQVWGKAALVLEKIQKAIDAGHDTTFDVYPYTAGSTSLVSCIPPWAFEGGMQNVLRRLLDKEIRNKIIADMEKGSPGRESYAKGSKVWNNIMIANVVNEENRWLEGKTIQEIAEFQNKNPYETVIDILTSESGRVQIINHTMSEQDMTDFICHPQAIIASDGMSLSAEGIMSSGKPHPRAFGTRARVFAKYVKQMKRLTFEEAVKKMTSLPAKRLGLLKRGCIAEGYFADVVVINPDTVEDRATYLNPKQYSVGFDQVIVNGRIVLNNGVHQENYPGRVLANSR